MINVKVDTSRLQSAMAEFAKLTRQDLSEVTRKQAAILVGHVIAITPPGASKGQAMNDTGGIALDAKKRGENAIAADIAKLFPTSKEPHDRLVGMVNSGFMWQVGKGRKTRVRDVAESIEQIALVHKYARNPATGRTRIIGGINMAVTRAPLLKAYIRQEIKKVGLLNAGWISAARELKTAGRALPAWITRHGAQGGGSDISDFGQRIAIRIFNNQPWFPNGMDARVNYALAYREKGIIADIKRRLIKNGKKAERKMCSGA